MKSIRTPFLLLMTACLAVGCDSAATSPNAPPPIIRTIDITITEDRSTATTFAIDAVFDIDAVANATKYELEVLEMNPNSNPSQIGRQITWTPTTNAFPLVMNGAGFRFWLDYGAGAASSNTAVIAQARAFYAGVTGKARVTITVGS